MIPGAGVTGSGELAGTSAAEVMRVIAGECASEPHLPYLPLLPERGPGADPVGRTASLLTLVSDQFAVGTTPAGWRIDSADSREMRRGRSWVGEDLDAAEEQLLGYSRDFLVPVVGPWTMAASVELATGHRLIRDHGAVRDLTQALGEAYAVHAAEVARRLPLARPVMRIDEPLLPAAMAGELSTPSGLDRYRSIERVRATEALSSVIAASGVECVLRCARGAVPLTTFAASGASGVSFDLASVTLSRDGDVIGELVDSQHTVIVGVSLSDVDNTVNTLGGWWTSLGFAPETLPQSVAIAPEWRGQPSHDPVAEFTKLRAMSARLRDVSEERGDSDG